MTTVSKLRPLLRRAIATQHARPMTVLSKQSAEEYKKQNYNSRMAATGRPVSPHVTVYSFPAGALSSITNRVTGMGLSFGAVGLGAVEMIGGSGAAADLMSSIGSNGGLVTVTAKLVVGFPLVYHYMGGIRHLVWDNMPDTLTNSDVETASYALVGASAVVSGGLLFM
mmetsp:Transcript_5312/g.7423  ORF Transcript_5312/g.7423 Transcript_5312/m.7423 type:complete len:168 (-) Transcript_5312:66-569(-)